MLVSRGFSINQKGVAHLLLLLVILVGMIAAVYLVVTGNLKLFSKASNPPIVFKDIEGKLLSTKDNMPQSSSARVKIELTAPLPVSAGGETLSPSQTFTIPRGYSFVGLAMQPREGYSAEDFLKELNAGFTPKSDDNKVLAIYRWDKEKDQFDYHVVGKEENNFPINVGAGYIIKSNKEGQSLISGTTLSSSEILIPAGKSVISLPYIAKTMTTASSLLNEMNKQGIDIKFIRVFSNDKLVTYKPGSNDVDFPLVSGVGYYLWNNSNVDSKFKLTGDMANSGITFKFAENPGDLEKTDLPAIPYTSDPTVVDYEFKDKTPGKKFIWVEFTSKDGKKDRHSAAIELTGGVDSTTPVASSSATPSSDIFNFNDDTNSTSNITNLLGTLTASPANVNAADSVKITWDLSFDPVKEDTIYVFQAYSKAGRSLQEDNIIDRSRPSGADDNKGISWGQVDTIWVNACKPGVVYSNEESRIERLTKPAVAKKGSCTYMLPKYSNTSYRFGYYGLGTNGQYLYSNLVSVVNVLTSPPDLYRKPSNFTASCKSGELDLKWDPVEENSVFELSILNTTDKNDRGFPMEIKRVFITNTNFSMSGLKAAKKYYVNLWTVGEDKQRQNSGLGQEFICENSN